MAKDGGYQFPATTTQRNWIWRLDRDATWMIDQDDWLRADGTEEVDDLLDLAISERVTWVRPWGGPGEPEDVWHVGYGGWRGSASRCGLDFAERVIKRAWGQLGERPRLCDACLTGRADAFLAWGSVGQRRRRGVW